MVHRKTPPEFCKGLRHIAKKTAAFIIAALIIISCIPPVSAGEEDGRDKATVNDYTWLWGMPAGYKGNFGIGITGQNLGKISNGDFKFEPVGKDDPDKVIAANVDSNRSLIPPGYWGDNTLLWINLNVGDEYTDTGLPAGRQVGDLEENRLRNVMIHFGNLFLSCQLDFFSITIKCQNMRVYNLTGYKHYDSTSGTMFMRAFQTIHLSSSRENVSHGPRFVASVWIGTLLGPPKPPPFTAVR